MPRLIPAATKAECIRLRRDEQLSTPAIAKKVGLSNCAAYKILKPYPWRGKRVHPSEWKPAEIAVLERLWPSASHAELLAALPGRKFLALSRKACNLGFRRLSPKQRHNDLPVLPQIQALRTERHQRRLSRSQLSARAGYHLNQLLGWENGKAHPNLRAFVEWAEALGMEVVVRRTGPIVREIELPSKTAMMGRR